jgi:hypothetical protein
MPKKQITEAAAVARVNRALSRSGQVVHMFRWGSPDFVRYGRCGLHDGEKFIGCELEEMARNLRVLKPSERIAE